MEGNRREKLLQLGFLWSALFPNIFLTFISLKSTHYVAFQIKFQVTLYSDAVLYYDLMDLMYGF
jgi:hypothetical protein